MGRSTVCSSAPRSQAEQAIPHLCKQEQKRPTLVRRRLIWTYAVLERVIPGVWVLEVRSLVVLFNHSAFHRWSVQCAARMMLSDERMNCCATGTNGCLDLRRRAFALDGQVSAEWSWCPGYMARRSRDVVAPLRRGSEGWMPTRVRRLSAGVGRRHPGVVDGRVSEAGVSTAAPDKSAVLCCWVDQG